MSSTVTTIMSMTILKIVEKAPLWKDVLRKVNRFLYSYFYLGWVHFAQGLSNPLIADCSIANICREDNS